MSIEQTLLEKCVARDERAMHILYKKCFSVMKGISVRYQQNEDDVNEAINRSFLKIIQHLKTYDASKEFASWYKTIVINTNIDLYRKLRRHNDKFLYVENCSLYETTENEVTDDFKITYKELLILIKKLPPMTNNVFNLFAIDGYSHKEIAQILEISDGTSKWHVSDARKKLRMWLNNSLAQKIAK